MEQCTHVLHDAYVLESFVGGLKSAVKPFVKAFNPANVTEAIKYARLQEEALMLNNQKLDKSYSFGTQKYEKPTQGFNSSSNTKSYTPLSSHPNAIKPPLLPTPVSKPLVSEITKESGRQPFKFISADLTEE